MADEQRQTAAAWQDKVRSEPVLTPALMLEI